MNLIQTSCINTEIYTQPSNIFGLQYNQKGGNDESKRQ